MAGAGPWRTLARINFPLLMPALLASGILSFVVAMESFEIPQLLGTPAKIFMLTTRIYELAYSGHSSASERPGARCCSALTRDPIAVQSQLLNGSAYTTIASADTARRSTRQPCAR